MLNTINDEETVRLAKEVYRGAARCSRSARDYAKRFNHKELTDCGIAFYDDRKMEAALNTLPRVKQIFKNADKDISKKILIDEDWFCCNAILSESLDMQNEDYNFVLGAAIWILDELKKAGELEPEGDAITFIMESAKNLDIQVSIPDFWDVDYGQDLVASVMAIITYRNHDCHIDSKTRNLISRHPNIKFDRCFGDPCSVKHTCHQDVPSRTLFDKLLSLVSDEAKKRATVKFENCIWNVIERYAKCRCTYATKEIEIPQTLERLQKQSAALYNESIDANCCPSPTAVLASPTMNQSPAYTMTARTAFSRDRINRLEKLKRLQDEVAKAQDESDLVMQQISTLWCAMADLPMWSPDGIKKEYDEVVYAVWKDFAIEDPYELCFAALYLIETDNDLIWLNNSRNLLMDFVGTSLPWFTNPKTDDKGFPSASVDDGYVAPYKIQFMSESGIPRNWAQIVYQLTGSLWPRKISEIALNEYNLDSSSPANNLLLDCMRQSSDWGHSLMERDCGLSESDVLGNDNADEVAKLREEVAELKKQLHQADKAALSLRDDYENLSAERKSEMLELAALRDWMFKQQSADSSENTLESTSGFPVHTKTQKIVSYGGHPTWLKAIRPMLPDVKFYDGDVVPNKDLMANADAIWIQPNCIGHRSYYKIMNVVKSYNIPLFYFDFSSARLCASQLVDALNLKCE